MGSHGRRSQSGMVLSESAGIGRPVRSLHGRSSTKRMARNERCQRVRVRGINMFRNPCFPLERLQRAPVDTVIRILSVLSIGLGAVALFFSALHAVVVYVIIHLICIAN